VLKISIKKAHLTCVISYHKSSKIEPFSQVLSFWSHLIALEYQFPLKEKNLLMICVSRITPLMFTWKLSNTGLVLSLQTHNGLKV